MLRRFSIGLKTPKISKIPGCGIHKNPQEVL